MGTICSKLCNSSSPSTAKDDPFTQPGRTLASAPPAQRSASVPQKHTVGGPARTLAPSPTPGGSSQAADARRKAAEAAEARLNAGSKTKGGKLEKQLQEQKKMTMNDTLAAASKDERRQRELDAQQASRTYN